MITDSAFRQAQRNYDNMVPGDDEWTRDELIELLDKHVQKAYQTEWHGIIIKWYRELQMETIEMGYEPDTFEKFEKQLTPKMVNDIFSNEIQDYKHE